MRMLILLLIALQPSIGLAYMPPSRTLTFEETAQSFADAPPEMKVEIDRVNQKIRYVDVAKELIVEYQWSNGEAHMLRHFDLQGNPVAWHDFSNGSHWELVREKPAGVKDVLRSMSTACELYATANRGVYPASIEDLTSGTPAYLKEDYCSTGIDDYRFECDLSANDYFFKAVPLRSTGKVYTMRTGGILEE